MTTSEDDRTPAVVTAIVTTLLELYEKYNPGWVYSKPFRKGKFVYCRNRDIEFENVLLVYNKETDGYETDTVKSPADWFVWYKRVRESFRG